MCEGCAQRIKEVLICISLITEYDDSDDELRHKKINFSIFIFKVTTTSFLVKGVEAVGERLNSNGTSLSIDAHFHNVREIPLPIQSKFNTVQVNSLRR